MMAPFIVQLYKHLVIDASGRRSSRSKLSGISARDDDDGGTKEI